MNQRGGMSAFEAGPDLVTKDPLHLGLVRQNLKHRLDEAEADPAVFGQKFDRSTGDIIRPYLAVADDAVTRELKSGDAK
jgi:hypothetical protein